MKVVEIINEGMDLDFVRLYKSYGSWMHPQQRQPIYVQDQQQHVATAEKMLGQQRVPEKSAYHQMFDLGWVRAVHGGMNDFSLTGTAQALSALLPQIAALRNAVNYINLDVEDCSGSRCVQGASGRFEMPAQWNDLRRTIAGA